MIVYGVAAVALPRALKSRMNEPDSVVEPGIAPLTASTSDDEPPLVAPRSSFRRPPAETSREATVRVPADSPGLSMAWLLAVVTDPLTVPLPPSVAPAATLVFDVVLPLTISLPELTE